MWLLDSCHVVDIDRGDSGGDWGGLEEGINVESMGPTRGDGRNCGVGLPTGVGWCELGRPPGGAMVVAVLASRLCPKAACSV